MNFSCPSCETKYYVADERVVGRTLKMKCRKCPEEIPIQGRPTSVAPREGGESNGGAAVSSISSDRLRLSLPPRRAESAAARHVPSLPPAAREGAAREGAAREDAALTYRVAIAGKSEGPFDRQNLEMGLERGEMTPHSFVWRPGMDRWKRMLEVDELRPLLESIPPPSSTTPLSVRPGALVEMQSESDDGAPFSERPTKLTDLERERREQEIEEELGFGEFSTRRRTWSSHPPRPHATSASSTISSGPPVVLPTGNAPGKWVVIAATLGSLALGIVLGTWFAGTRSPGVIREVVEVPVEELAENVPPPESLQEEQSSGSQAEAFEVQKGVALPGPGAKALPSPGTSPKAAEASPDKEGQALSGLEGLSSAEGPRGPDGGKSSSEVFDARQPLSTAQIKRTISAYQGSVKRGCWQPALEGRSAMAPSTARVAVQVTVAPSGSVSAASASGDPPGYPGLSSCIVSRVRTFRFPASSGETDVTIPFVFAAQ